jgi:Ca2+-binding RTX toxin-like protein
MKKRLLTIFSLILIGVMLIQNNGFGMFDEKIAYAVGGLAVTWDATPMFNESNIAPGYSKANSVNVANQDASPRAVAIKGIKKQDYANMSSVMHIEIKEGTTTLYSDTLKNFFTASNSPFGVYLSNINSGENTDYDIKITFDEIAGNQYQNNKIVFDLQIGITVELPAACRNIVYPNNAIVGTSGNDKINGTSMNDLIVTFEGDDKVTASGGDDCIVTGDGNDKVDGGTGKDVIDLGNGEDKVSASGDTDYIYGRAGNDVIDGGSGDDYIYGGSGKDDLSGGAGNDRVFGEEDNDRLDGGSGMDLLDGGEGTDKAIGGSGIDTCIAETRVNCEL